MAVKDIRKINIGMMGFGYIAHGVFELVSNQKGYISHKIGRQLEIIRIAEKDPERIRSIPRPVLKEIAVSTDAADVYNDPEVDIVILVIRHLKWI